MRYLAILRGINVSGQKKINMQDLRSLFESLGMQNVKSYIQSGNVVFESNIDDKKALKAEIEASIEKQYEFHVPVELRTYLEWEAIVNECPFAPIDVETQGTKVLITFLSGQATAERVTEIKIYVHPPEQLIIKGKEVYLNCPNGYGKTKLSNTFLERKLGVVATTRNWKSVVKLHELLSGS
jgi:uncharacterized protein (DUF1697 family)